MTIGLPIGVTAGDATSGLVEVVFSVIDGAMSIALSGAFEPGVVARNAPIPA